MIILENSTFNRIRPSSYSGILVVVVDVSNMQVLLEMVISDLMVINGIIVNIRLMQVGNFEENEQNAIT